MKRPSTKAPFPLRFGDKIDFSRWGVVSFNDDTGLGRQAMDMRTVLGLGYLFVRPSTRLETKPLIGAQEYLVPLDAPEEYFSSVLEELQGIFVLERVAFHLPLVRAAKAKGIIIACVPNWELFGGWFSSQNQADIFLCPSQMTYRFLKFFGFTNSVQVPCPINLNLFPARELSGPARYFVHNAGLVYKDDRKATREVIEAFKRVPRSDIRLVVRLQKSAQLPPLDPRITISVGNLNEPSELYAEGDVAIQPSKLEGIGFSVLEAVLSGIPVITSDFPPMNEFVRDPQLLCRVGKRFHRPSQYDGYYHAFLKRPDINDLAKKIQWCTENDMTPFSQKNLAMRTEMFSAEGVRVKWLSTLQAYVDGRLSTTNRHFTYATPLFFVSSAFFRSIRAFFEWRRIHWTNGRRTCQAPC